MRSISNYTGQGNIILRNRQLNFNNLVAVITDSRIQEDTLTLIYYSEETQAAAKAAVISVQSNTGNLTFTAASTPSMPIVCDIVLLSANIVNQVANASDIDYDNTNSGLSATDVQEAIDQIMGGVVLHTVVGDGVKSLKQVLNELYPYAQNNCSLVFINETSGAVSGIYVGLNKDGYCRTYQSSSGSIISNTIRLDPTDSSWRDLTITTANVVTNTDISSQVSINGRKYSIVQRSF